MSTPDFAMLTPDDLVTGEAVALDLPPATVGARIGSGLIDVAVDAALVAVGVLFLTFVATADTDGALQHVALVVLPHRGLPRLPDHRRDAHPRQVASASWRSGCAWCATTAARSPPSSPSSGP